ncbi:cytochrome o ubiquinol oxidase subunit III [Candidatus Saccharibacteria bacterium]|nr:MAG: cytochrome o ubiquinol oxidase subunit III [Candidatus Saccharibacteria bacterium]
MVAWLSEAQKMNHVESHEEASTDRVMFGFWIYLMTDLLMFAALFAVFAVLRNNTAGEPSGKDIFSLPFVLIETLILLTSSFTCGLGMIAARNKDKAKVMLWFGVTMLLGLIFLTLEIKEFSTILHEGHSWRDSAFLSSFFVLVGTHGLHITSGILWLAVTLRYIARQGLNHHKIRKLALISLFWHFLDIVWIFIFTVVYLMSFIN